MKLLRLFPDNTRFGFMRFRRLAFPFSAALSVATIALFFTVAMNFGIDFTGGTLIEMQAKSGKVAIADVRRVAEGLSLGEPEVQEFGDKGEVSMRFGLQPGGEQGQKIVTDKVRAAFSADYDFRR
ncbi:MAG: protein translocase subunit SecF, partial [Bosea sp. (in: a-proteobacteria)]